MGPAAICSAGTDTYRPGALCTDSAMYHPLVVWSRLRFSRQCCAMLPEAVRSSPGRYVPSPALHIAAGPICSASDMYRQFDRYEAGAVSVAPQPVICSALGAISAVCHARTLSSLQRPLPNAERRVPEAHRHVPRRARRRHRRRLLRGVGGGDSQRRAPARRRVAGAGR